jgi:hypothetical protein
MIKGILMISVGVLLVVNSVSLLYQRSLTKEWKKQAIFWHEQNDKSQILVDTLLKRNNDLIKISERAIFKYQTK